MHQLCDALQCFCPIKTKNVTNFMLAWYSCIILLKIQSKQTYNLLL